MPDEDNAFRDMAGSAFRYVEIINLARCSSEAYAESGNHITPEIHDALRRQRFLFEQLEGSNDDNDQRKRQATVPAEDQSDR